MNLDEQAAVDVLEEVRLRAKQSPGEWIDYPIPGVHAAWGDASKCAEWFNQKIKEFGEAWPDYEWTGYSMRPKSDGNSVSICYLPQD
jgi:hypothetical protein